MDTNFFAATSGMREWYQLKLSNSIFSDTIVDIYAQFALKVRGLKSATYVHIKVSLTTSGMRE